SLIHAAHSNNMSDMGGMRRFMPSTYWTFVIGSLALAGIPPLAGFWSKDEILADASRNGHTIILVVGVVTAILTAFYMGRALRLIFFGEYRGHEHPHESPRVMTLPLVTLAGLTAVVGFFGVPWLTGGFKTLVHLPGEAELAEFDWLVAGGTVILAVLSLAAAWRLYTTYRRPDPMLRMGPLSTLLERKFYLDDIYLGGVVRPIQYRLAAATNWTNTYILDGIVNAAAWLTRRFGTATNAVDRHVVDGVVNRVGVATGWTGGLLRYVQSGNVQRYAVILFAGVAVLAVIFTRI
ncbi:MAG: hypothetical protein M3135_02445, partial [Actinomycetota bacterium]|nr:hypothetical protein [Actinomycetota bacterium]